MKKIFMILVAGWMMSAYSATNVVKTDVITLTNPILKRIDGIAPFMHGRVIGDILHIRHKGRMLHYGVPNKEKRVMEGTLPYNGQKYSIHQLAGIEHEIDTWYENECRSLEQRYLQCQNLDGDLERGLRALHAECDEDFEKKLADIHKAGYKEVDAEVAELKLRRKYLKNMKRRSLALRDDVCKKYGGNDTAYQEALGELKATYEAKLAPLAECLLQAREAFKELNSPYLKQVHGAKAFLYRLVVESCMKRQRYDSFLLKWAEVAEGSEFDELDKTMTRMQTFDIFLEDLSNFFEDLVHSCPIGYKQYMEIKNKQ